MNYEETLRYIHGVQWQMNKPGLERTQHLLRQLGNPEKGLKFIHIAGTNGKGSTAAMLASILETAGYRTGLYTSPYINRFNERMQINGQPISDDEVVELIAGIRPFADAMTGDMPTEFEVITALAMEFFSRHACDIVVLEVGMGGELDSTNVIDAPEVAVLTAMGFDHTSELGDTMAKIASAKAGIVKTGCDVVAYGKNPEAEAVFEQTCRERGATLRYPDYTALTSHSFGLDGQIFSYKNLETLHIPLAGSYQLNNAAVVLTVVEALQQRGWQITEDHIRQGLSATRWPARFEVLQKDPVFIVDGGHNPHGIQGTADSLQKIFPGQKFTFLVGVMADKDVESILSLIVPLAKRFYCVTPNNPRAMAAEVLAQRIRALGVEAIPCESIEGGIRTAMEYSGRDGVTCALGSLYMAGDVRACFIK